MLKHINQVLTMQDFVYLILQWTNFDKILSKHQLKSDVVNHSAKLHVALIIGRHRLVITILRTGQMAGVVHNN